MSLLLEREEGREEERGREASIGSLLYTPGLGIEPATFQLWNDAPTT